MPNHVYANKALKLTAAGAVVLLLAGCGGGTGAPAKGNALKDAPKEVAALYKARCISCHGSELQGKVGANTDLTKVGSRMSAEQIAEQIRSGKGLMPAFESSLSDEEIKGLSDWLAAKK
ncbi:c-type cytochrome [Paenibacillus sp. GCM10027627]|uniref:c-type cytochrome n=1 Tax=unclassified Paenibacillus TaxID=185978 RepID=UPI003642D498